MKTVPIETQKKLVYLPIVNFVCPFIHLYNCFAKKTGSVMVWFIVMLACSLPFVVLSHLTAGYPHQIVELINILSIYVPYLLSGVILIKYQEKLDFE